MGLVLQLSWLPLVDINLHGSSIAAVMVAMGFHQFPSVYRSCHGCHGCSVAGGFRRKAKRCESDASSGFASDISSKEGIGNCISPLMGLPAKKLGFFVTLTYSSFFGLKCPHPLRGAFRGV